MLVKIASSVLILLYMFANFTLILFRESKISSYRPKFHAPFYPYMQILGVLGGVFLLIETGSFVVFLTMIFLVLGIVWYKVYAEKRATQDTALICVLEKLVAKDKELTSESLLTELKDIVIHREGIIGERFQGLIEDAEVLDIDEPLKMEDFFKKVSETLSRELNVPAEMMFNNFIEREEETSTVIDKGLAIPHIFIEKENVDKIILVRAKDGIIFSDDQLVHIAFVLVGSTGQRILHLKILAAIAQVTQDPDFRKNWKKAKSKGELKNLILLAEKKKH